MDYVLECDSENNETNSGPVHVGRNNNCSSNVDVSAGYDSAQMRMQVAKDVHGEDIDSCANAGEKVRTDSLAHTEAINPYETSEVKVETDYDDVIYTENLAATEERHNLQNEKMYIKTEPLSDDTDQKLNEEYADMDTVNYDFKIVKIEAEDETHEMGVNNNVGSICNNTGGEKNSHETILPSPRDLYIPKSESKTKSLKCQFCGKCFLSSKYLDRHIRTHRNHQCKVCSKVYRSLKNLRAHEAIHGDKVYKCSQCDKSFKCSRHLKSHEAIHGDKIHECIRCDKSFAKKETLKQHMNVHTKEHGATCEFCGQSFSRASDLKRHLKLHTMQRDHVCGICGRSYINAYELKYHMPTHNEEGKSFRCDICSKSYKYERDLKSHMSVHSVDTQNVCEICGKVFDRKFNLKRHLKRHADRPFSCDICGKRFKDDSDLRLHELRHNKMK